MPEPAPDEELQALVDRADLDGLIRLIDARSTTRDWAGLRRLRDTARHHTARQLWPAASLAEYRLALLAPPPWAAGVLDESSGYFTVGPLTEVVAATHTFDELRPYLDIGPRAAFVAHERVLRGDDVDPDGLADVLEIPYRLERWEPAYALAAYHDNGGEFPSPAVPKPATVVEADTGNPRRTDDADDITIAVRQLVETWTAASTGRAEAVAVQGDASVAVAALGLLSVRVAPVQASTAMAWLAWAGASGGAHGRRRGAALGRFGAWWTVASIAGLVDDWPVPPDELGAAANEMAWYWWDDGSPATGWTLRLLVEDPESDVSVAINATDAAL